MALERWPERRRETIARFKVFDVVVAHRTSPRTGREHGFFVVDTWSWVNVVAFDEDEHLVLVHQYRQGSEEFTLEIPGGAIDPGEDAAIAARRELLEETGYEVAPDRLEYLGTVNPNPALFTNRCDTFLARDCRKVAEIAPDAGEDLEVVRLPLDEVEQRVRRGEIVHALVLAGLYHYRLANAGG